jgi:hypothetical protein
MVNFKGALETQRCTFSVSKKHETFYIDSSRSVLILGIIAQLLALLELFKNRDFVWEMVCKRWHCARGGPSFYVT